MMSVDPGGRRIIKKKRSGERRVRRSVSQAAAVEALNGPQDGVRERAEQFRMRRDRVVELLNRMPGIVCPKPRGAFYVFPDVSAYFGKIHGPTGLKIANDVDLCNALLDAKGVACVPGSAFGEPRALRISYTCPTPQLAPGLQRIQEFFAEMH